MLQSELQAFKVWHSSENLSGRQLSSFASELPRKQSRSRLMVSHHRSVTEHESSIVQLVLQRYFAVNTTYLSTTAFPFVRRPSTFTSLGNASSRNSREVRRDRKRKEHDESRCVESNNRCQVMHQGSQQSLIRHFSLVENHTP